ncbi:MAG: HAD family phosphatase [Phycisphaeraceae bacterium]
MSATSPVGLIFDMDDTLAATTAVWRQAERRLFASVGQTFDEDLARKYKGMNALDLAAVVHRELQLDEDLPALQQRMRSYLIEAFAAVAIEPMPGSVELVRRVARLGPSAVASGSPQQAIDVVLDRLGLADAFDITLSSEAVPRGKPAPDVFLAAADRLGIAPACCVVFEDSLVGVQAARAAGMACFVVPSLPDPAIAGVASQVLASWCDLERSHVEQHCRLRPA